jgi:hypothetical protein
LIHSSTQRWTLLPELMSLLSRWKIMLRRFKT